MNDDDEKELRKIIIRAQAKQYDDEETLAIVAERAYRLGRETGQREAASLRHAALLAAGIHGGPGAWRWASDPRGTTLDDTEAWGRLLGEMRERTAYREQCNAARARGECSTCGFAPCLCDQQ